MKGFIKRADSGIWISFAASFMLFIYAPLDFYFSGVEQFAYDIYDILLYMFPVFVAVLILSSVVMILVSARKRLYYFVLELYVSALIATFVQGTFMAGFLPVLDGRDVVWSDFAGQRYYSFALWVAVIGIVFFVKHKMSGHSFEKAMKYTGIIGMAFMLFTVLISGITVKDAFRNKFDISTSDAYLLDMSDDTNFVVLLLDSVDAETFSAVSERHPEYAEYFRDFTFFRNTMGVDIATARSLPFILNGEWYENDCGIDDFTAESVKNSDLLNTAKSKGYRMTMYDNDLTYVDGCFDLFDNITYAERFVNPVRFVKMQMLFTGLRYFPFDLKQYCLLPWEVIEYNSAKDCDIGSQYSCLNSFFCNKLGTEEINVVSDKQFHFIMLFGAHGNIYDSEVNEIENGTYSQAVEAAITVAGRYLEKLRESNTYDNTVIIVLADHGGGDHFPYGRQNPILFIKGLNERHSYCISDAPVSFEDLQEAYRRLFEGKPSGEVFDWKEGDARERRFLLLDYDARKYYEYIQYGHASDESTMVATGREY